MSSYSCIDEEQDAYFRSDGNVVELCCCSSEGA